jgi:regulator of nonsense transcripts 2
LIRKKTAQNLDSRYGLMIDNALHECNPPDVPLGPQKIRPPIQIFLRKLIYSDLNRSNALQTLKLLRKLDWKDPIVLRTLEKMFTKVWKVKYANISLLAFLCAELSIWYPEFGAMIVDYTLEELQCGLETNIFNHNQRRVAVAKYIGELHNYRMIGNQIVFDSLYLLLRYGHENGIPSPNVLCPSDAPDDFFRLRLCCTILDSCGGCFTGGKTGAKLDTFFVFMQMYIFTKVAPIPIEAEFFISETKELLRPFMQFYSTFQETVDELNRRIMEQKALEAKDGVSDEEDDGVHAGGSNTQLDFPDQKVKTVRDLATDSLGKRVVPEEVEPVEMETLEPEDEDVDEEDDDDQDDLDATIEREQEDQDEADFEREFSRLMHESLDSRRNARKVMPFDASVPSRIKANDPVSEGQVAFTLLTKRGNKQQVVIIH